MALTATDWTVTVQSNHIGNKERRTLCKCELASGTYPSNGIPIPANGKLGMGRNVSHIIISDADSFGNQLKYDKDNGTIRVFLASTPGTELATTATVGSAVLATIYIEAVGW